MRAIVQQFLGELAMGLPRRSTDSNLLRAYEFQQKRLDEAGLELKINTSPYGHFPEGWEVTAWQDDHYRTSVTATTAIYERAFYKKGQPKPLKKISDNYLIYTDVTDCTDYSVSENDSYICPNCGSVSTLLKLSHEGCDYCGTKFAMSELYPKVSGYYAIKNMGATEKELKGQIFSYVKPVWIVFAIIGLVAAIGAFTETTVPMAILTAIWYQIMMAIFAFLFGYLAWVGKTLGRLFKEAGKAIPKVSALGSHKAFTEYMKQYSQEFSYEYFINKVISMLKTVIYSSQDAYLPFYYGKETVQFDHIVEASFSGALRLNGFHMQGSILSVDVTAFMENFYCKNGRIKKKDEKIHMVLQKDMAVGMNYYFNVQAVKCPSCGSSFDATKSRFCPYCNQPLNMLLQDWVMVVCEK